MLKHRPMSADEAMSFSHNSVANDVAVLSELASRGTPGCTCLPRIDVLTMPRWNALGKKVKKGSKSMSIPTIIINEEFDESTGENKKDRKFGSARVFCRCQTEDMSQKHKDFQAKRRAEWQAKHPNVDVYVASSQ